MEELGDDYDVTKLDETWSDGVDMSYLSRYTAESQES